MTRTFPTFARELLEARERLRLPDEIGLALRAHRRMLGLSQRAYASWRGRSRSWIARLEADAEQIKLGDVVQALEATPFRLYLGPAPSCPQTSSSTLVALSVGAPATTNPVTTLPEPISPDSWERSELLARDRSGRRRFPGHRQTRQVSNPPLWWWFNESTRATAVPPNWYAPVVPLRLAE